MAAKGFDGRGIKDILLVNGAAKTLGGGAGASGAGAGADGYGAGAGTASGKPFFNGGHYYDSSEESDADSFCSGNYDKIESRGNTAEDNGGQNDGADPKL